MRIRGRLSAVMATMTRPATFSPQTGLASSDPTAISAITELPTAARTVGSLVMTPATAVTITAPTPAQNQPADSIRGYTETEARITAMAAVTVSRMFIPPLPAG